MSNCSIETCYSNLHTHWEVRPLLSRLKRSDIIRNTPCLCQHPAVRSLLTRKHRLCAYMY